MQNGVIQYKCMLGYISPYLRPGKKFFKYVNIHALSKLFWKIHFCCMCAASASGLRSRNLILCGLGHRRNLRRDSFDGMLATPFTFEKSPLPNLMCGPFWKGTLHPDSKNIDSCPHNSHRQPSMTRGCNVAIIVKTQCCWHWPLGVRRQWGTQMSHFFVRVA